MSPADPGQSSLPPAPDARRAAHWRATRRLTAVLLSCWFLITFPMIFFARQLAGVVLFGWPLSFYMAAQGAILAYVLIIGIYAWRMRCLDRRFHDGGGHG
ncbi:MAG: DUF4212 domain-containing protein [Janthinobacterium lividum]